MAKARKAPRKTSIINDYGQIELSMAGLVIGTLRYKGFVDFVDSELSAYIPKDSPQQADLSLGETLVVLLGQLCRNRNVPVWNLSKNLGTEPMAAWLKRPDFVPSMFTVERVSTLISAMVAYDPTKFYRAVEAHLISKTEGAGKKSITSPQLKKLYQRATNLKTILIPDSADTYKLLEASEKLGLEPIVALPFEHEAVQAGFAANEGDDFNWEHHELYRKIERGYDLNYGLDPSLIMQRPIDLAKITGNGQFTFAGKGKNKEPRTGTFVLIHAGDNSFANELDDAFEQKYGLWTVQPNFIGAGRRCYAHYQQALTVMHLEQQKGSTIDYTKRAFFAGPTVYVPSFKHLEAVNAIMKLTKLTQSILKCDVDNFRLGQKLKPACKDYFIISADRMGYEWELKTNKISQKFTRDNQVLQYLEQGAPQEIAQLYSAQYLAPYFEALEQGYDDYCAHLPDIKAILKEDREKAHWSPFGPDDDEDPYGAEPDDSFAYCDPVLEPSLTGGDIFLEILRILKTQG